ncbi:MAG: alpha/beta hydrolase [Pseudomonadota bacterium]
MRLNTGALWDIAKGVAVFLAAIAALISAVAGTATASPSSKNTNRESAPGGGFFVTVSGPNQPAVKLHGIDVGPRRARTIVLLHGLGASSYSWRRVISRLSRRYRVIALDLRGHGRSDKPFDVHYAVTAQAELVRDALAKLKLRRVTLVGHSYGGVVSLVATLQANARGERRIRRLVIMNSPALPQKLSTAVRFLQQPVLPYVALTVVPPHITVSMALFAEAFGMPHITEQDIEIYAQPYLDAAARHALIETARQIVPRNAADLIKAYPSVRQQTLVVWCRSDQVVPLITGQRLARMLPNARLEVLEGCDHATPEQKPDDIARLISRHVRRR